MADIGVFGKTRLPQSHVIWSEAMDGSPRAESSDRGLCLQPALLLQHTLSLAAVFIPPPANWRVLRARAVRILRQPAS